MECLLRIKYRQEKSLKFMAILIKSIEQIPTLNSEKKKVQS